MAICYMEKFCDDLSDPERSEGFPEVGIVLHSEIFRAKRYAQEDVVLAG